MRINKTRNVMAAGIKPKRGRGLRLTAALLLLGMALTFAACGRAAESGQKLTDQKSTEQTPAAQTSAGQKSSDQKSSAQASADPKKAESKLNDVVLVLDWVPNTNHSGIFIAEWMGYYADEGLNVVLQNPPEGGAEVLVAAGQAPFGVSFQDSMAPALIGDNKLPITAVAAILQHNTSGILSLKEAGITGPKALEGKRYATWNTPVELAMMKNVVEAAGGDFSKVDLLPSTVTDVITALKTDVDAVWVYYGWDGIAAEVQALPTNYWAFKDMNPIFDYYSPVIIANQKYLQEQPDTAKAFLRATKKGYEYAIAHPEEAAEIMLKTNPELEADLVKASQKYLADQYAAAGESWGRIDPARWEAFYAWLWENKLIEAEIPAGEGYSNDFLP